MDLKTWARGAAETGSFANAARPGGLGNGERWTDWVLGSGGIGNGELRN